MQVRAKTSTFHELLEDMELIVVSFDTWVVLCQLEEVYRLDDARVVQPTADVELFEHCRVYASCDFIIVHDVLTLVNASEVQVG